MNNVKVSIIVPVYNVEKYIDRCLNSLVNQTLKDIEIIIVNDNTPDNSMKICNEYASRDDRIKIYNKKKNEGLGLTRNYGISKATGEFIAFVDSDDYVDVDFYEKLYNRIIETNSDICFGEYKSIINQKEKIITSQIPYDKNIETTQKVLYNMLKFKSKKRKYAKGFLEVTVWQSIYKKSIIDENSILFDSEREYLAEDILFNFYYLLNSKTASFVRGTYYNYCFNGMSLTHKYTPDKLKKAKLLKNKLIELAKQYKQFELSKEIERHFIGNVRQAIRQEIDKEETIKNKKETIKEIVKDKDVRYALKNKTRDNFRNEIFNFLIKTKQVGILIFLHKFVNKFK